MKAKWFGLTALMLAAGFIFSGIGAALLTNLVGVVFPAYMSFKALESDASEDDTVWLVYWSVFSLLYILDWLYDAILFWIPFYYPVKLCFIIWLFLPATRGAERIYRKWVKIYVVKYGDQIDQKLDVGQRKAEHVFQRGKETVVNAAYGAKQH